MSRFIIPKNGIRKKPAASVPRILQSVPILPTRPITDPVLSKFFIRSFVAIGCIMPRKKLTGTKRVRVAKNEENLTSVNILVINTSTASFIKGRLKNKKPQNKKRNESVLSHAHLSAIFQP
jgi:hypothetical protein